jgi:hypothetical protein
MRNRFFVVFCGISRKSTKHSSPCPLLVEEGIQGWWSSNAKGYSTLIFS